MEMTKRLVTPEMAEELLANNHSNRRLARVDVAKYARDMSRGRWRECVAPILLGADGRLIDGQHRLMAVVRSGVPQTFYFAENPGWAEPSDAAVDMGKPRAAKTFSDISPRYFSFAKLCLTQDDNTKPSIPEIVEAAEVIAGRLKLQRNSNAVHKVMERAHVLVARAAMDCLGYAGSETADAIARGDVVFMARHQAAASWINQLSRGMQFCGRRIDGKAVEYGKDVAVSFFDLVTRSMQRGATVYVPAKGISVTDDWRTIRQTVCAHFGITPLS